MDKIYIGIDLGGTTVKIGFFSMDGNVLCKWEIPTRKEDGGEHILPDIAEAIKLELSKQKMEMSQAAGIGIGVPGPVMEEREVFECVNLGWNRVDVAARMKELTGVPIVKVGNDANVAALGEMWKGGGEGYDNIVMVTLGTGVGGGIIMNRKMIAGSKGAAGEIGHITVNPMEELFCNCGKRGCLEQYASATGIVRETKKALGISDIPSTLREKENISAKTVFDEAKKGDKFALTMVEQLGFYLGLALSHVGHTVDPQAFVIGGGVSKAGSILTATVSRHYDEFSMKALKGRDFKLAMLGNDAGIYGAARMLLDL